MIGVLLEEGPTKVDVMFDGDDERQGETSEEAKTTVATTVDGVCEEDIDGGLPIEGDNDEAVEDDLEVLLFSSASDEAKIACPRRLLSDSGGDDGVDDTCGEGVLSPIML